MAFMNRIDTCELDGRLLQLLLAVLDTGSVTAASVRLGVTQSAVSHGLDRLRALTGDPLFVKSGRGIAATARAEALAEPARELLTGMGRFAQHGAFDPASWRCTFTVAANDFQRDLLLPALAVRLRERAPGVSLRIVPSAVPRAEMLRNDECQLVITPRPPEGTDIIQKLLFQDHYRVFYDPAVRKAPQSIAEYLAADHATVVYEPRRSIDLDQQLAARGVVRRFAVMVPGFSALPAFMRGTALLATVPSLLARHTLADLASCEPPLPCPAMPMYALWHVRYRHDDAHHWLVQQLLDLVRPVLSLPAGVPRASAEASFPFAA
ncbi:LysR family transcriptional regulator [Caenimonas koreensis DSM 17982]|uniref:LysR family transcriptional regulator n=1 Tax=Caenimonas koreensis DSM 17982 TaxID=1121255 RepID=A0A844B391_9BURK|nr:LysR family transcriptional regulator [Caenimonas koreensis]MRD46017.1 LysR family transcriptional regulator [Caenimonas koreensis DSM 17982]